MNSLEDDFSHLMSPILSTIDDDAKRQDDKERVAYESSQNEKGVASPSQWGEKSFTNSETPLFTPNPGRAPSMMRSTSRQLFDTSETKVDAPRPMSSQGFRSSPSYASMAAGPSFSNELNSYNGWVRNLNTNEQILTMDLLLNALTPEALRYVKNKLDNLDIDQPQVKSPWAYTPTTGSRPMSPILSFSREPSALEEMLKKKSSSFVPWDLEPSISRPRSVEPSLYSNLSNSNVPSNVPSSLSGLGFSPVADYSKVNPQHYMKSRMANTQSVPPSQLEGYSHQNKLNAVSTINSRAQLDMNKKFEESSRNGNVIDAYKPSSVPPSLKNPSSMGSPAQGTKNFRKLAVYGNNKPELKMAYPQPQTPKSANAAIRPDQPKSPVPMDITSEELLVNIPAWLKTLRLHKYTDNLRQVHWTEMVKMDEGGLEQAGIATLGARTKLLKAFETVREYHQI